MKKIIVIFDSRKEELQKVLEPLSAFSDETIRVEWKDISVKGPKARKSNLALLHNHGTTNTPLYLFEEDGDTYNSHYVEHGILTKELAIKKLKNE